LYFILFCKNLVLRTSIFEKKCGQARISALQAGNVQPLHRCAGDPRCSELALKMAIKNFSKKIKKV